MSIPRQEAIGEHIEAVDILGELPNEQDQIVEADIMLTVQRLGRCSLTVVTKKHYENMVLKRHSDDIDRLETGVIEFTDEDTSHPYVINEDSITDQLLRDKFLHHAVWPALDECLIPQED